MARSRTRTSSERNRQPARTRCSSTTDLPAPLCPVIASARPDPSGALTAAPWWVRTRDRSGSMPKGGTSDGLTARAPNSSYTRHPSSTVHHRVRLAAGVPSAATNEPPSRVSSLMRSRAAASFPFLSPLPFPLPFLGSRWSRR